MALFIGVQVLIAQSITHLNKTRAHEADLTAQAVGQVHHQGVGAYEAHWE